MRVDSSGNVGIGTTAPTQKLEVAGATASRFVVTETRTPVSAQVAANTVEAIFGSYTNHRVVFRANNTEQMRLDTSGNLLFNSGYGSVATAYGCRAWVNFNGSGTVAIRSSFNVNSMTDDGTGTYRANFSTALPDTNYTGAGFSASNTTSNGFYECDIWPNTSSASWILVHWQDSFYDLDYVGAQWIR